MVVATSPRCGKCYDLVVVVGAEENGQSSDARGNEIHPTL
jgi:hypothetical protein